MVKILMVVCEKMKTTVAINVPMNKGESPVNEGDERVRHQEKKVAKTK